MRTISICILNLLLFISVHAQDTVKYFSFPEFIQTVKTYHPVAKQADLIVQEAKAELLSARGNFDPLLSSSYGQKTFDGTNYYQHWNPEIRIPTWYGIELRGGLEEVYGERTNNSVTLGQTSYAGISVPLARNLLIDQRRAILKQAKIFRSQSEEEKKILLNDLIFDASVAYWNWVAAYQYFNTVKNLVQINEERFRFIKNSFLQGDRPAIDTTEALTQLQNFISIQIDATLDLQNRNLELSNFLWLQNDSTYTLPQDVIPSGTLDELQNINITASSVDQLVSDAMLNHPILRSYNFKLQGLEVDRSYKFQGLLPYVNVKANLLNKGYNVTKGVDAAMLQNNHIVGLDVAIPLRFSQGRGDYRKAKIKIEDTRYEISFKSKEIENKIRAYYNEMNALSEQVRVNEAAYRNFATLVRGEETRFRLGESSLFLLNTRENKLLEVQQKIIELKAKYLKTVSALQWSAGILYR